MTYHPTAMVRPDAITRTGVIRPFNVVDEDPVNYARHEIDPFIKAIRSQGASVVKMDGGPLPTFQGGGLPTFQGGGLGGLGIISPEVIRTLSGGFGQDDTLEPSPVSYADFDAMRTKAEKARTQRWVFGAVGVALGVGAMFAASRLF